MSRRVLGATLAIALASALAAGCASSGGQSHSAAAILRADGYTVTTPGGPFRGAVHLGEVSAASGVKGTAAEEVLVFGGDKSAPACQSDPALCTPAGMADVLRVQDPGTRARVDGQVVRITGPAATFRKDGLPL